MLKTGIMEKWLVKNLKLVSVKVMKVLGRTAKELGIALTEAEGPLPVSCLDHALYLGRELQKAEACLKAGVAYTQD